MPPLYGRCVGSEPGIVAQDCKLFFISVGLYVIIFFLSHAGLCFLSADGCPLCRGSVAPVGCSVLVGVQTVLYGCPQMFGILAVPFQCVDYTVDIVFFFCPVAEKQMYAGVGKHGLVVENLQYAEIVVVAYHRGELLAKQVVMAARLQLVLELAQMHLGAVMQLNRASILHSTSRFTLCVSHAGGPAPRHGGGTSAPRPVRDVA